MSDNVSVIVEMVFDTAGRFFGPIVLKKNPFYLLRLEPHPLPSLREMGGGVLAFVSSFYNPFALTVFRVLRIKEY